MSYYESHKKQFDLLFDLYIWLKEKKKDKSEQEEPKKEEPLTLTVFSATAQRHADLWIRQKVKEWQKQGRMLEEYLRVPPPPPPWTILDVNRVLPHLNAWDRLGVLLVLNGRTPEEYIMSEKGIASDVFREVVEEMVNRAVANIFSDALVDMRKNAQAKAIEEQFKCTKPYCKKEGEHEHKTRGKRKKQIRSDEVAVLNGDAAVTV